MMQRAVQEAQKGANGDKNTILRNLRRTWKPVSGMLKSVESANRVAHTYDGAVMRQYMEEAGISENDLSHMARRALAGDALYDRPRGRWP